MLPLLCTVVVFLALAFGIPAVYSYEHLLVHTEFYFLCATVLVLIAVSDESFASHVSLERIRALGASFVLSTALVSLAFLAVKPQFRILADETNLLATSLSLYLERTYKLITQGLNYFEMYHIVSYDPPTRPGLYPFLTYLLHALLGYDPYHGFWVNFAVGVVLGVVVFQYVSERGGRRMALCATLLLMSYPLHALSVTSSGFEELNLLCAFLVLVAADHYLSQPSLLRFELLFLASVLASQSRYETLVVFLPLAAVGSAHAKPLLKDRARWHFWLLPFMLLPIVWLPVVWQRRVMGTQGLPPNFSVSNVPHNAWAGIQFLLNQGEGNNASAPLVFVLAVVGAGLFVKRRWHEGRLAKPHHKALLYFFFCLLLIVGVQSAYSEGDLLLPASARFGVILVAPLALAAAYALNSLRAKTSRIAYSLAGLLVVLNLACASVNEKGKSLLLYREYQQHLDFLQSYPKGNTLVITDRPGLYVVHLFSAVDFDYANGNFDDISAGMSRHLYHQVVVIQFVSYADEKVTPVLDPRYRLRTIKEYQNSADYFIRISKVL